VPSSALHLHLTNINLTANYVHVKNFEISRLCNVAMKLYSSTAAYKIMLIATSLQKPSLQPHRMTILSSEWFGFAVLDSFSSTNWTRSIALQYETNIEHSIKMLYLFKTLKNIAQTIEKNTQSK